jgi:hypothetical protein
MSSLSLSLLDNKKKFIPYKIDKKNGIMKYVTMEKRFSDFRTIISEIEEKIKKTKKKSTSQQYYQQEKNTSNNNNVIGITEDARMKLKIKGYKGDKLVDYYDKIKDKLQGFLEQINEKMIDFIDMNTGFIQTEKEDIKFAKKLIQIRNKIQPNCSSNKYKTSGVFSNAFSEKLAFTSAEPILKQISTDFEICLEYLLSIIKEYCNGAGITSSIGNFVQFNTMLLFEKEKSPRNLQQYKQQYQSQYQPQYQQQYQQQYQPQYQQQYQYLMRGGKSRKKTHKKITSKNK